MSRFLTETLDGIEITRAKEVQKKKIGENVDLVVQALKKIESDIRSRFDDVGLIRARCQADALWPNFME